MADKEKPSGKIFDSRVLRRLYAYIKPYEGKFYYLIFLTVLLGVLAPLRPILIQYTVDNDINAGDLQGLLNMFIILIVLLIIQSAVQFSHTYQSGWLGQQVIKDIRIKLYNHISKLRLKYFDNTPIGRLVTRNISDVETLADVFSEGFAGIVADSLQLIFILGVMLFIDWRLTLVSLSTLPLLLISTYIFKEKIKVSFNQVRTAVSNLNSFVQEHITGMSIVQIFNTEKQEMEKFRQINREHRKANVRSVFYYAVYFPIAEIISASALGLLVWYGARGVLMERVTLGILIEFIMYIQMFFRPIRQIADRFNTLQLGIVSSERIFNVFDTNEIIPNTGLVKKEHLNGDVAFKNVWFSYNPDQPVLKDISFEVKSGKTLALVGATGAGKSSVINLLSRFYDIDKGLITIDGVDIKQYELDFLRSNIAVVLQDVFLFSNTIYENITLGNPEITREKVIEAAELVGAKKFIDRLPGGFDFNVMERGATLSVGQRQLISFVRALVYDPKIIVLDEATSSVDSEAEELIQEAIEKLMKGRTSVVIAHRLSTIQKADKILVLEKGEIKEEGKHEDLLELNGYYAQLYKMQYKLVV
ncbi:MAG TPA: ABC transporter ATP-binding protein [Cytophagales bacterium]|nr:ABC transporter ATP-binding protein [Cytophagales bacterium]